MEEAVKVLLEEGPQAVSVKRIAERLGTSRSPFFRAFGSRSELFRKVFEFYNKETSEKVYQSVRSYNGPPAEKFWMFWISIIELDIFRYDLPFRRWSLIDRQIGSFVNAMDQERIAFMRGLYRDLGYGEEESDHRACFAYFEYIGILVTGRETVSKEFLKSRAKYRFYLHTVPPMPEDFRLPEVEWEARDRSS